MLETGILACSYSVDEAEKCQSHDVDPRRHEDDVAGERPVAMSSRLQWFTHVQVDRTSVGMTCWSHSPKDTTTDHGLRSGGADGHLLFFD